MLRLSFGSKAQVGARLRPPKKSQQKEDGMKLTRRQFLKAGTAGVGGFTVFHTLGWRSSPGTSHKASALKNKISETTTICPYDASGCGFIAAVEADGVLKIEGDPDHPINRGAACAKGASLAQLHQVDGKINPRRLQNPLYRPPGGTDWEVLSWDEAIDRIARRIKDTRDNNWTASDGEGYVVNRTEGIASVGGAALDNEECYLLVKALRALGLVYVEHQARI